MFLSADVLVQAVMLGLAFASVVTWTVWLAKLIELKMAMRRLRLQMLAIAKQRTLSEAAQHLPPGRGVMQAFVRAAEDELELSSDLTDKTGMKERIATRLQRLETAATPTCIEVQDCSRPSAPRHRSWGCLERCGGS
jgi:biopolymer transport protein ExbB